MPRLPLSRRDFIRLGAAGVLGSSVSWMPAFAADAAANPRRKRSCILLWMNGGPATIDLLMSEGHAKLLSSPDLVTVPGAEATFLVGGKIPIPVSNGLGSVTVQYVDFGVKLKVTPTVLGSGGIECKITPEVSNLDFADAVTLNGFTIPALKISTLSTDVITQTGESIVMGGLLNRIESVNVTKIPLLSDIPILGKLFRSTNYQKSETDVVFILTPTIITR